MALYSALISASFDVEHGVRNHAVRGVVIVTDSNQTFDSFNNLEKIAAGGWITAKKDPWSHKDLWEKILEIKKELTTELANGQLRLVKIEKSHRLGRGTTLADVPNTFDYAVTFGNYLADQEAGIARDSEVK
jgi:hypothetical protein